MKDQHEQAVELDNKPRYEPPSVKKMSEKEVLEAFQVTSAGISWWIM